MSSKIATLGLDKLWQLSAGDRRIKVAILDGPVDTEHPSFAGAKLTRHPTMIDEPATPEGVMARHGTHVASVVFGQPGTAVVGIAPGCEGLILPVFSDRRAGLSQLDLSRAIRQAVDLGAHVINISGGQAIEEGGSNDILAQAVELCRAHNVLIVAAAGNDGCACLHSPAALPTVLAVGAMDDQRRPLDISNWGSVYREQGLLAPGVEIEGAVPGGATERATGTSFAAPIVSGVAALLLSVASQAGLPPDPQAVRAALLASASACALSPDFDHRRCLAGILDPAGALALLQGKHSMKSQPPVSTSSFAQPSGCGCTLGADERDDDDHDDDDHDDDEFDDDGDDDGAHVEIERAVIASSRGRNAVPSRAGLRPSRAPGRMQRIYALGVLGYDFGTEARRDTYKQLMPAVTIEGVTVPANPYDARQMVDYLGQNLSEARSLIWTLNLELTPVYALEPVGSFARDIYGYLHRMLSGQIQPEGNEDFIERVSIPGRLTDRTVRLYSGQIIPVVEVEQPRGLYGWNVNVLRDAAISAVKAKHPEVPEEAAQRSLSSFLNKIYYELRNLGQTSQERAMNFAATNAFQAAAAFSDAVSSGMELDGIEVQRSPFCRMDSDCWDVILSFFDADNVLRARKLFRFTIDVSDSVPVTMGEVRSWSSR